MHWFSHSPHQTLSGSGRERVSQAGGDSDPHKVAAGNSSLAKRGIADRTVRRPCQIPPHRVESSDRVAGMITADRLTADSRRGQF